jgi:putative ATP-binding cassette transporter
MRVLVMLLKRSCFACVLAGILAMAGGGITVALLALINHVVLSGDYSAKMVWLFVSLTIARLLASGIGHIVIVRLSARSTYEMSMDLVFRIMQVPLRRLEEIGQPRLMAIFSRDIAVVSNLIVVMPYQLVNLIIIIGSLVYLGILSGQVCVGIMVIGGLGIVSFSLPIMYARRYFYLAREENDSLHKHFRSVIEGAKELKLHCSRQHIFVRHVLEKVALNVRKYKVKGTSIYAVASHWNRLLFFVYVGLLIFTAPSFLKIGPAGLAGYILVLLYMMAPIEAIQNAIPAIVGAEVALKRLEDFDLSLVEEPPGLNEDSLVNKLHKCNTLRLEQVVYSYRNSEDDSHFRLGPLSLTLSRGEVVFLVGGNGSGKTTLVKVLVGLYRPEAGEIYFDDVRITDEIIELYRQQFSVVFQDFWLFESLFGLQEDSDLDRDANRWLEVLELQDKVKVEEGVLSTIQLSRGQQKRLALLTGLMEDRPFYVFDEWAADQDPVYKRVFYEEILPNLKNQGKAVLVITHDDRYWHLADRLVKLDSGQMSYRNLFTERPSYSRNSVVP